MDITIPVTGGKGANNDKGGKLLANQAANTFTLSNVTKRRLLTSCIVCLSALLRHAAPEMLDGSRAAARNYRGRADPSTFLCAASALASLYSR